MGSQFCSICKEEHLPDAMSFVCHSCWLDPTPLERALEEFRDDECTKKQFVRFLDEYLDDWFCKRERSICAAAQRRKTEREKAMNVLKTPGPAIRPTGLVKPNVTITPGQINPLDGFGIR